MWFVILVCLCAALTGLFPEYILYTLSVPFLLTFLAIMSDNAWDENLALIILFPLLLIMIF